MTGGPRRLVVTGTPGVGKTTVTRELSLPVCHLNEAIRTEGLAEGTDTERSSLVADMAAVEQYVDRWETEQTGDWVVIESHLAHRLPADRVVVLRCRPDLLADRLRERGETDASVEENRNSEALDVITGEAAGRHDEVYEIDTTDDTPPTTADAVRAVLEGRREPAVGTVDFLSYVTE